ncbi:hypothetical protein GQ42DRAFT_28958 [Ramicandelaber brevisporus]|nr:hypothetical protein GQ42DRAFT_28958 [Ramicandelaber brevisporus]
MVDTAATSAQSLSNDSGHMSGASPVKGSITPVGTDNEVGSTGSPVEKTQIQSNGNHTQQQQQQQQQQLQQQQQQGGQNSQEWGLDGLEFDGLPEDEDGGTFEQEEEEEVDFNYMYALFDFVGVVEGQVCVSQGDQLTLLDDSNSYWWLVQVNTTMAMGYIPADNVETPNERLARINKSRNVKLQAPDPSSADKPGAHHVTKPRRIPIGAGIKFVDGLVTLEFETYQYDEYDDEDEDEDDDHDGEGEDYDEEEDAERYEDENSDEHDSEHQHQHQHQQQQQQRRRNQQRHGDGGEVGEYEDDEEAARIRRMRDIEEFDENSETSMSQDEYDPRRHSADSDSTTSSSSAAAGQVVPRSSTSSNGAGNRSSMFSELDIDMDSVMRNEMGIPGPVIPHDIRRLSVLEETELSVTAGQEAASAAASADPTLLPIPVTFVSAAGAEFNGTVFVHDEDSFSQILIRAVTQFAPGDATRHEEFKLLAYIDNMRYGIALHPEERMSTVLSYLAEPGQGAHERLHLLLKHDVAPPEEVQQTQQSQQQQQQQQQQQTKQHSSANGNRTSIMMDDATAKQLMESIDGPSASTATITAAPTAANGQGITTDAANGSYDSPIPRPQKASNDPQDAVTKLLRRISAPMGPPPPELIANRRSINGSDFRQSIIEAGNASTTSFGAAKIKSADDVSNQSLTASRSLLSNSIAPIPEGKNGEEEDSYQEEVLDGPTTHTIHRQSIAQPSPSGAAMVDLARSASNASSASAVTAAASQLSSVELPLDDWLVLVRGWNITLDSHSPNDLPYTDSTTGQTAYFFAPEDQTSLFAWDKFAEFSRGIGHHIDLLDKDLDTMVMQYIDMFAPALVN